MPSSSVKPPRTRLRSSISAGLIVALIAVHVVALGAVLLLMQNRSELRAKRLVVRTVGGSFERLAASLGALATPPAPELRSRLQEFNHDAIWEGLRIVTVDGEIVSSASQEEIGTRHWQIERLKSSWPTELSIEWFDSGHGLLEHVVCRVPLKSKAHQPAMMLEGILRLHRLLPTGDTLDRAALAVAAGSLAVFLFLCILLRRHYRPLANIGSHLLRSRQRLMEEISDLRLAGETAAVASAWNELVGAVEELRDDAGKVSAYQELNKALQQNSSSAFIEAANVIPEGLLHLVRGGRLSYANNMACRLLGIGPDGGQATRKVEGTELWLLETSPLGCRLIEAVKSAHSDGHFEAKSVTVSGPDESAFRVRVMPAIHKDREGDAIVSIRDVSQSVKAEVAREEFLAQVAHELRTPLTNIQAYAETYAEYDDPAVQNECFNVINKETRRLARLVEELLSRSQLDLGTIAVRRDDVDLLAMLHEATRDLKATAEAKGIELIAELPSKLPKLNADRDKLSVVVNNLIGNAIKYTKANGRIWVRGRVSGASVVIEIADTGIGIAPEDQELIFDRSYRVDSDDVRMQQGSGIGLTTAAQIVQLHGGVIKVDSELGTGSTFMVELPLTTDVPPRRE